MMYVVSIDKFMIKFHGKNTFKLVLSSWECAYIISWTGEVAIVNLPVDWHSTKYPLRTMLNDCESI